MHYQFVNLEKSLVKSLLHPEVLKEMGKLNGPSEVLKYDIKTNGRIR
jgi:hypothetical protein